MKTVIFCVLLTVTAVPLVCRAETSLQRGAYLVETVAACGICHSPVDQQGNRSGPALSGGPATLSPVFTAYPPNITSDPTTGIGGWSEEQIVDALRNGRTPDGRILRPPMPIPLYRSLSDNDAHAIAAYLKGLPPTVAQVPVSTYKVSTPKGYGPSVEHVADPDRSDLVAYGTYLSKVGHCVQCHTPVGVDGRRDYVNRLGAGGLSVDIAWGSRMSANITPDPETGIGRWSDDQIVTAISHGIAADGGSLSPIMPWPYWQSMKLEDLRALVAWLRSLKPINNVVAR